MVTLKKIYDDVFATFAGDVRDFDPTTVINWINEAYIEIRDEFIKMNQYDHFTIEEQVLTFRPDRRIPYLVVASLRGKILQHTTYDNLVVYAICRKYNPIRNINQSWAKGDRAWIGERLYEAVNPIININSYNRTFENCDVRNYYPQNGLKYKVDDVVIEDGIYYRAITENINNLSTPLSTRAQWQQVYWKYVGIGFVDPEIIDFHLVDRKKAAIDTGATVMSFDTDSVYASQGVRSATIRYVPVHEWKRKNKDEFTLPDSAYTAWRNLIHERMHRNRGQIIGENG